MLTRPPLALGAGLRATARSPLPGYLLLLAAPALVALARGHRDLTAATTFMAIAAPPVVALALDDPAEATLNACPTSRNTRRVTRASLIIAALAAVAGAVAIAINAIGATGGPIRDRLPEGTAAAAISLAAAARATRAGQRSSPGLTAALATPLIVATSTGLSMGVASFELLPQVGNPHHALRWCIIASAAATATWWSSRDPASRGPAAAARLFHHRVTARTAD